MKRYTLLIVCVAIVLLLATSCALIDVTPARTPDTDGDVAGFWKGLWHGIIMLFTFIISLFKDNVDNLGFLLGVMIFFGGSSGGVCCKGK